MGHMLLLWSGAIHADNDQFKEKQQVQFIMLDYNQSVQEKTEIGAPDDHGWQTWAMTADIINQLMVLITILLHTIMLLLKSYSEHFAFDFIYFRYLISNWKENQCSK